MIKDTIDFDYAISKILQGTETNIHLQPDILKSDNLNESFKQIETTLNTLYEKTRYLEDSIAYTKQFLDTRITYFNNEINAVLHEIENVADSAKNLSYISYNVPFVENTKEILDRNKTTTLTPLIIKNGCLTLNDMTNKIQPWSMWTRVCDSIPYEDNISKVKDEAYRVVYLEEKLMPEGLSETIYVHFAEPTAFTSLNIKLSNCTIHNMVFGLINGTEEYIGDYTMDMKVSTRICTYIKFDLVCTNYELMEYEVEKVNITDNIWGQIKETAYNDISNIETTKLKYDMHCSHIRRKHRHRYKHIQYDKVMPVLSASKAISDFLHHMNKHHHHHKYVTKDKNHNETVITSKPTYEPEVEDSVQVEEVVEPTYTIMTMYNYVFGIDLFEVRNNDYVTDGYMISDPITIGNLSEGGYIRLEVKHQKQGFAEISYSIMDGDVEVPIAIMEEDYIENELVFENVDTRFPIDFDASVNYEPEIVKLNGTAITGNYNEAKDKAKNTTDRYSVTYKPSVDSFDYKPLNNTIQIKCYIRTYGKSEQIPYIQSITIKKYGEESLWINRF